MKVILLNGSPRKNWNTHKLLMEAERGAKEMGAETEMIHLYDLNYTDCKSCFACKLRGTRQMETALSAMIFVRFWRNFMRQMP